ncbi:MAG: folylpolyglutamate synthase/dihydrofolate synthase family protein [Verrucomicrobiota bacterium]|jgi:dihydrofolate synthase/folylpolyglutamate synthase
MTYAEAIQFLYDLRLFGAKFGLENTFKLAALAGNPQNQLRFIHVAGTNGKGSTCAMLESIYRAAGLRVGLFTSPHLVSFRERIQVNRQLISEQDMVRLVREMQALQRSAGAPPAPTSNPEKTGRRDACATFFEFVTVMALKFFAEQKCDLVVWETGLGGRLDATNIVTPLAGVITNIALDHQQWLGDTLEKIAAEKAGIIKPGVPVITAADEPEALAVIEKTAREKHAPLIKVGQASSLSSAGKMPAPPLIGDHQKLNAALALATVEVLQDKIPVSDVAMRNGLQNVNWPGRLQLVRRPSGQKFLLDGAHNVAGAKVLRQALEKYFGGTRRILVLGVLQDKDWRHICETLAPLAARILTVPVSSERTADAHKLAAACRAVNLTAEIVACDSLREALGKLASDDFVVITGSLYLVGEALESFGLSPATSDERALNEWGACPQPLYTTG